MAFLGPESPRPLSVISESYQHRYIIPRLPSEDRFTFGTSYDDCMYEMLHKYLELGTTDRVCYVGETKGSFAEEIADRFCVMEPILTVIPGHYSYVETDTQKVLPIRVANVGAEEFFRLQLKAKDDAKYTFDKIILKDAIRYFERPVEFYENAMKCLSENGKLLIISRPSDVNTLPVFRGAKQRMDDNETPYMDLINDLQSLDYDVQWEIECLPIVISKRKWYSMLNAKFPPQMEIMSDFEIRSGVRELSEGIMKYEDDLVEFNDRLLFVTVTNLLPRKKGFTSVKRYGANEMTPCPNINNLNYSMELTGDLKTMMRKPINGPIPRRSGLF